MKLLGHLPEAIRECCKEVDSNKSDEKAEHNSPDDEAWIPEVVSGIEAEVQQRHPKVEEDDAVHGGAEHADEVVDCYLRLVRDVLECVVTLNDTTAYNY